MKQIDGFNVPSFSVWDCYMRNKTIEHPYCVNMSCFKCIYYTDGENEEAFKKWLKEQGNE